MSFFFEVLIFKYFVKQIPDIMSFLPFVLRDASRKRTQPLYLKEWDFAGRATWDFPTAGAQIPVSITDLPKYTGRSVLNSGTRCGFLIILAGKHILDSIQTF